MEQDMIITHILWSVLCMALMARKPADDCFSLHFLHILNVKLIQGTGYDFLTHSVICPVNDAHG